MRLWLSLFVFVPFVSGCLGSGGGGGAQSSVPTTPVTVSPSGLTYSQQINVFTVGQTGNITPTLTAGLADSYSVDLALPAGLSLNSSNGTLSGTVTAVSATAYYTITASNSAGSTTTIVQITVNDVAPSGLSYTQSTVAYLVGSSIATNNPTNSGGVITQYSVSPALPAGLSLSPLGGAITGTATAVSSSTNYVITGTNSGGSTATTVSITVNAPTSVIISPGFKSLLVGESFSFSALFGLANYVYSVASGVGVVNSASGNFSSAAAGESVVRVTDSLASTSDAKVKVLAVQPKVATGSSHACAIFDGALSCWGRNNFLQLGLSQMAVTESTVPVAVPGLSSGVTDVAAGTEHTCVVHNNAAKCFGRNTRGALGNGTTTTGLLTQVTGLTSGVTQVSVGTYHSCALVSGGVWCWGYNNTLGNGSVNTDSLVPVAVTGLGTGVLQISSGGFHTCALLSNGGVRCWGYNTNGQLGDNSTLTRYSPVDVSGISSGATQISAAGEDGGGFTTCVVQNGAAKCWGENGRYQLGNGTTTDSAIPVQVTGLTSGVVGVSAGHFHTCALLSDQTAKCWGTYILSVDAGASARTTPVFVRNSNDTANLSNVSQIATKGPSSTCLVIGAEVSCFGSGTYGRLGNGVETDMPLPKLIKYPN